MATTTRRTTVPSVKVARKRLTSANQRKRKAITAANAAQRTLTRSPQALPHLPEVAERG